MPRHLDVLIAGQGIAGSLLAYQLIARGLDVCVVDPGLPKGTASRAAAGILSPYTGRRYRAPSELGAMLDECHRTYGAIAEQLGTAVFHPQGIWRIVQRPAEQQDIERRRGEHPGQELMTPVQHGGLPSGMNAPLGATRINGGGQVDMDILLSGLRHWFAANDSLITAQLNCSDLSLPAARPIAWAGMTADTVVFCDGAGAFSNPWWHWLPWRASRGETVDVEPDEPQTWPQVIVTGSKSLVPLAEGRYRIGSTYDHAPVAGTPTEDAQKALLDALPGLTDGIQTARVTAGRTGIRPGSRSGSPFAGFHPKNARIGILNGFGSRGTLYAPWLARRLADRLMDGTPLPEHMDVERLSGLSTQ